MLQPPSVAPENVPTDTVGKDKELPSGAEEEDWVQDHKRDLRDVADMLLELPPP